MERVTLFVSHTLSSFSSHESVMDIGARTLTLNGDTVHFLDEVEAGKVAEEFQRDMRELKNV